MRCLLQSLPRCHPSSKTDWIFFSLAMPKVVSCFILNLKKKGQSPKQYFSGFWLFLGEGGKSWWKERDEPFLSKQHWLLQVVETAGKWLQRLYLNTSSSSFPFSFIPFFSQINIFHFNLFSASSTLPLIICISLYLNTMNHIKQVQNNKFKWNISGLVLSLCQEGFVGEKKLNFQSTLLEVINTFLHLHRMH